MTEIDAASPTSIPALIQDEAVTRRKIVRDAGLFIERRGFLIDGRNAEFTQSFYRGDAYDLVAELNNR